MEVFSSVLSTYTLEEFFSPFFDDSSNQNFESIHFESDNSLLLGVDSKVVFFSFLIKEMKYTQRGKRSEHQDS